MVSSLIEVESAEYVGVDVQAQVGALPYYRNADVQQAAVGAIRALLDFDGVDFGQTLYLSKVYEALEGLDGAANVFVSRFRRATDAQDIAPGGVITLAEHEVPIAGAITVTVTGGA